MFDESISKGYDFAEIEFEKDKKETPSLPQWRRAEMLEQRK